MKKPFFPLCVVSVTWATFFASLCHAGIEVCELQSGPNRLALDDATGAVKILTQAQRSLLTQTDILGPFRLHVPIEDFYAHMVEGHHTKPAIFKKDNQLICTYSKLNGKRGPMDISVVVTITSIGDGSFELNCRIHNQTNITIPQVFFPWIGGFKQIDNKDDCVTFGKEQFEPWKAWSKPSDEERLYFMANIARPSFYLSYCDSYRAGMKWMDYGGTNAGVSLYSTDTGAKQQFMLVSADRFGDDAVDLAWYFYPYIGPGQVWESPTFVLYSHQGNWRTGVLKFKEFTDKAFAPVKSSADRDLSIGQYSLWISWHYQDWRDLKYRFTDIPAIAAEARKAGFREMTLVRATELDFCLPHVIRKPLGTEKQLKDAAEETRKLGVNTNLWLTCRLIRPDTIPAGQDKNEWYLLDVAGQPARGNWSYDPLMTPHDSIYQVGTRAGYFICTASKNWQKAYWDNLDMVTNKLDFHGILFDISQPSVLGPCYNPQHNHRPDGEGDHTLEVVAKTKKILVQRFGDQGTFTGECQWDAATQYMDYTWDWLRLGDVEKTAPFYMAFPHARRCYKCDDHKSLINRIFTSGYWLDAYIKDGGARLGDYPELTQYFRSLAAFKEHFVKCLSQRDTYFYDMYVQIEGGKNAWVRTHRSGDQALIMVTEADGNDASYKLTIDVEKILGAGERKVEIWTRTLKKLSSQTANGNVTLQVNVPKEDFMAIHLLPVENKDNINCTKAKGVLNDH
jgi:hypothetical protein